MDKSFLSIFLCFVLTNVVVLSSNILLRNISIVQHVIHIPTVLGDKSENSIMREILEGHVQLSVTLCIAKDI